MRRTFFLSLLLCVLTALNLEAKITLPAIISDHMVLQQNTQAALFGWAQPGATVTATATWQMSPVTVKADAKTGYFLLRVPTPSAGGPYEITLKDTESLTIKDVLIGEVWFCSGQSNMEMPVKGYGSQPAKDGTKYIVSAKASRPIRIVNVARKSSLKEETQSTGSWMQHTPTAVASTSATAYFFAEALQAAIDVPVGIIHTSWGGSSIQTWIKRDVIEKEFKGEFDLGYLDGKAAVKSENQDPCLLWNGQVAPLVPYTFKGMIWYQGETNRGNPEQYIRLQASYVQMMREVFSVPDAPFYFVQIAPYPYDNPDAWTCGYFYEAQQKSLQVIPHSGMATTVDIGQYGTIHPCRKQEVGQRLAYLALQHDYGFDAIKADAPTYKNVEFKEGKALVTFNVDDLGLSPMGEDIDGFEISGSDKVFHKAKARYQSGKVVIVSSDEVKDPVAVRYCFRNFKEGSLYNNFGIPAAPFRTDDWKL